MQVYCFDLSVFADPKANSRIVTRLHVAKDTSERLPQVLHRVFGVFSCGLLLTALALEGSGWRVRKAAGAGTAAAHRAGLRNYNQKLLSLSF
jgi:hypothetical protein